MGIVDALKAAFRWLAEFALGLGGPGLFLLAMADSSFISVPEGNDILIVVKSSGQGWLLMSYFVIMTVLGSTLGCTMLYSVGRWGGPRVTRRLNPRKVEEIGELYSRRGVFTIVIPAILPPPTPFKIFVLSAGVFRLPFPTFLTAVFIGRSIRYFMWGILAVLYGMAVRDWLVNNATTVGIFALAALLGLLAYLFWRIRAKMGKGGGGAKTAAGTAMIALALFSLHCDVKKTRTIPIPDAHRRAQTASLDQLVELVNKRYADFRNIAVTSLDVEFTSAAVEGRIIEEDKYRRAKGVLIAERPDRIYLNIKNPIGGASLAAMASRDGAFQIWVPREGKYFTGEVGVKIERQERDSRLSVRPQHLVAGLLVRPLPFGEPYRKILIKEHEDPRFKYYVLSVVRLEPGKPVALLERELWIERSKLRLARQRYYSPDGSLLSAIDYAKPTDVEGLLVNTEIDIERPQERYSMRFEFEPDGIRVNRPLPEEAFVVERPSGAEWIRLGEEAPENSAKPEAGRR